MIPKIAMRLEEVHIAINLVTLLNNADRMLIKSKLKQHIKELINVFLRYIGDSSKLAKDAAVQA